MFSRNKKLGQNEFFGVFRNIFGSSSQQNGQTISNATIQNSSVTQNYEKSSLKNKLKARFSSLKLPVSTKQQKNASLRLSPERFGRYNAIIASRPEYEDIDLTVNVSSILKNTSNYSRTSHNKRLRFVDETSLDGIKFKSNQIVDISFSPLEDNKQDLKFSENNLDEIESHESYYKRMKNEILERNKKIAPKKPKRTSSIKNKPIDFETKTQIGSLSNLLILSSDSEHENSADKFDMLNSAKESTCSETTVRDYLNLAGNVPNLLSALSKDSLLLQEWDDQKSFDFTFESMLDSGICHKPFVEDSTDMCDTDFCGKMSSSKRIKRNRFDPIPKKETCSVALLKRELSSNRMSWCSA